MKIKINIVLFFAGFLWFFSGINQQLKAEDMSGLFDIPLNDGQVLRIQACHNEIFRIRVSPTGEFQQTVMERYGIIKTD